ncbi:MAG: hypothetical protein H7A20_10605 [Rhodanobacteraceae bacterium]|nr:hypothetical protein [Rhodanobacteraceae bacterium]
MSDDSHGSMAIARAGAYAPRRDLQRIAGRRSDEITGVLGFSYGEAVIHRDDLVLLDHRAMNEGAR